jgi:hypothetical protein
VSVALVAADARGDLPDHRPKRSLALRVSMVCMEPVSTRTMGLSERKGMMVTLGAARDAVVGVKRDR